MTLTRTTSSRPQMALQSYLDGLLQDATEAEDLHVAPAVVDEFADAVREEQARDARQQARPAPREAAASPVPRPFAEPAPAVLPSVIPVEAPVVSVVEREVVAEASIPLLVEPPAVVALPLVDVHLPAPNLPVPPATVDGRPAWAAEPFECLLFDVAGLTWRCHWYAWARSIPWPARS